MKYFSYRLLYIIILIIFLPQFAYPEQEPVKPADGETPASLACVYGLTPSVPGCPIKSTIAVPHTGSGTIAVIEGGDDPDAYQELTQFSSQTGLRVLQECSSSPPPCFQTYYATATTCLAKGSPGAVPPTNTVTINEPQIDIEWSHAMAPNASIYMIETDSFDNLQTMLYGVQCANSLLQAQGGGFISFSDSFSEGPTETSYDGNFKIPGIIYVMSSGDYYAPARYPATSPYVIAAGGTTIERDAAGNYVDQVAWKNIGVICEPNKPCKYGVSGGPSAYEPRPSYQNSVQKIVGTKRGTPDISFVARDVDVFCCSFVSDTTNTQCCNRTGVNPPNPKLGTCQSVYSTICPSTFGTWLRTGGTSLAAPALAGIINSAHSGTTSSTEELSLIYNNAIKNYASYWTDIIRGDNGYHALKGYDFTTGLGVPRGYGGK